ncbi:PAS domain S-box-containing protein/diguanylate cyclase (GGDEF) domain-containing protein [Amycolatopsis tolypomycina]|uniref:PAS domain S-box-containing protein/diguanylate cyclase (GGDEF) domain-containing protein n=1 Tax=Amycolatopsis tolypomycina TaxID=208445 RepID=A0A1H5CJ94_9PSEU|nr:diguanylate cyclase [Amycolatopsis tolypomycina]SED66762.1 PAS domain S-box-containing protein/diguanylate cyclase (GGDEF) domain-containing protein [Amycolatopsis tolypomycina]
MTEPGRLPIPEPSEDGRRLLARKWAYLLAGIGYVPLEHAGFETELAALLDALCAEVHESGPERTGSPAAAGARLAELNCADGPALTVTMDVLGKGLLRLPEFQPAEEFAERVVGVLGALAASVVTAVQGATLAQQEGLKLSLLKAVRDAKYELRTAQARFDEVATSSASGILVADLDGTLVTVNAAAGVMLGHAPDELTGRDLLELVHPDYAPVLREDYRALLAGKVKRIKQSQRLLDRDGDPVPVSLTASLLRGAGDEPSHFVTVVEDGTELVLLQNELNRQALHDALTGLPNRQCFSTRMETALRKADPKLGVTLLRLELDAFSVVCDGLGEHAAEQLLVTVAQRLKSVLAGGKVLVSRFGGAEFAVLVENAPDTPDPVRLVHELRQELAEPTYVDGQGLALSASVGVVNRPAQDHEAATLLRESHQALRRAKANGHGQWELSHPDQNRLDRRTDALAAVMPGAFEHGDVQARYRPLVRLADGAVHGVEAQLGWAPPGEGALSDQRCRDLAETTGLMLSLGEWLLRTGCRQVGWWRQRLDRDLRLLVRLSPHQAADTDLLTRVVGVLEETRFPAGRLLVELPVPALAADLGETRDNLRALADVGVRPVVSAGVLAEVADLPVHGVRLDCGPLDGVEPDSPVVDVLRELPALAHRAGAEVIVDGLTSAGHARFWLAAGAELALGEHCGAPCRPEELAAALGVPGWRTP